MREALGGMRIWQPGRSPGSDRAHDIATVSSTHLFRLLSGCPSCAREHSGYSKVSIFLDSKGEGAKGRKGGMNLLCLSLKKKSPSR